MDALILAAGENVRLQAAGLPPGKKPLLIRDGEVMMRRLARQARIMCASRIIIVANPSNAEDIAFATHGYDPLIILQNRPHGPQHAVDTGLELVKSKRVMLLMGDNFIPKDVAAGIARISDLHPWVSTTRDADEALHALTGDGCFTHGPGKRRWLGPVVFNVDDWTTGCEDWVHAFTGTRFVMRDMEGIEDIGSLR